MRNSFMPIQSWLKCGLISLLLMIGLDVVMSQNLMALNDNPSQPQKPVKLIFIHHSCGENWLADNHGGLGKTLSNNNYFVSDTNYGWGPESIGDRTDITDWPEWFTGPRSSSYLAALYKESGKHSPYSRTISDPGGENQIIMFKSCFPNSNLEGRPTDPPARGDGLTVSNVKAIYNELLKYFSTRPDKLFIAITAPPVQDGTYAANARAFTTWLVKDWLAGYRGNNVAVFDFYNVLTSPENHHQFDSGKITYMNNKGKNTLYYPTNGDDHPSPAGNKKATKEFVPLLNVFYHRWQADKPAAAQPVPAPNVAPVPEPPKEKVTKETLPPPSSSHRIIDNFEQATDEWTAFVDESKNNRLTFSRDQTIAHSGTASLHISYDIAPESWATYSLVYAQPRDWRFAKGITVYLHAKKVGQPATIVAYNGKSSDSLSHFEFNMNTSKEAVTGWQRVDIPWSTFSQPSWEGDGTAKFDPGAAIGVAFTFEGIENGRDAGELWVDEVCFLSAP